MNAAETLVRELLPRLRRWTADSWALPATPAGSGRTATPARSGWPAGPGRSSRRAAGPLDPAVPTPQNGRPPTRATVTAAAVQRIADLGADAEGRPRRPVPRLDDRTLGDQLAVMVDDVLRTGDPVAVAATAAELAALARALGYRPASLS